MGNFSVNHYASLRVEGGALLLRYRIDIAELPTVEEMRALDANHDGVISEAERESYLQRRSAQLLGGLQLQIDGKAIPLSPAARTLNTRPGAADLPTLLLTIDCRVPLDESNDSRHRWVIEYTDGNYPGRAGWKEVVAAPGVGWDLQETDVPATDSSRGLEIYPADLTLAPPQSLSARLVVARSTTATPRELNPPPLTSSTATTPPPAAGPRTPQDRFTQLIATKNISAGFLLIAVVVAFGLGGFHGLAPGHGKTVVAAYLVGSRGTAHHAMLLGAVVTLTHVAGVFMLGFVVLFLSRYIIPEQLYPWLGFASGMTIVLVGAQQFVYRRASYLAAINGTPPPAGGHSHDPAAGGHSHQLPERLSLRSLIAMGISGGMVPCPSALIVLLGSIALGRVALGMVLIVAFSLGLASVLIAIGLMILYARRWVERFEWTKGRGLWMRRLPLFSSAAVALLGLVIAIQSLMSAGILRGSSQGNSVSVKR